MTHLGKQEWLFIDDTWLDGKVQQRRRISCLYLENVGQLMLGDCYGSLRGLSVLLISALGVENVVAYTHVL